jgi:hypothetical protein
MATGLPSQRLCVSGGPFSKSLFDGLGVEHLAAADKQVRQPASAGLILKPAPGETEPAQLAVQPLHVN